MIARRNRREDEGAVAVEFALILPLLVLLLFGVITFTRIYYAQIALSGAAREGARVMAVTNDWTAASSATVDAAPGLAGVTPVRDPLNCSPGATMTVTASQPTRTYAIPLYGDITVTLSGQGVMRCGG
jgi:Flp pilus assembly pilin Flp